MTNEDREVYDFFHNNSVKALNNFTKKYCGSYLGKGLYRTVYNYKVNSNYVVKIEDTSKGSFSNVVEWRIWQDNEEWKKFSKYLSPSIAIDETGQILVQRKVEFKSIDNYPSKMPSVFSDFKIQNYGWIGNQIVCVDYAGLLSRVNFQASLRLKKVK